MDTMFCKHILLYTISLAGAAILGSATVGGGEPCYVTLRTDAGLIRGVRREADGIVYYSFRNITYAKQPLDELRFQELQPAVPWDGEMDAIEDGPICPQHNILYGSLMTARVMSEACIHANVHVPADAPVRILRNYQCKSVRRPPYRPYRHNYGHVFRQNATRLPIFVFVHGGGFTFGSGDADLHGPEYLVSKGIIVVTFNYRLGAFGFLSLNTSTVPGNAGIRDVVTLLRWVRKNARTFGGNPNDITLGGQSAGAAAVHILSSNAENRRLFKRYIMMSGVADRSFVGSSPLNSARLAKTFIDKLEINAMDPDEIYEHLTNVPMESINSITGNILDNEGITSFMPVIESAHRGIQQIMATDTDEVTDELGVKTMSRIIGFTDNECQSFRHRFEEIDIINKIVANPLIMVPPTILFKIPIEELIEISKEVMARYFKGQPNMDDFIKYCSDSYFIYPALIAAERGGKSTYLYRFSYNGGGSLILQNGTGSTCAGAACEGAGHVEDLLYIFKTNSYSDFPFSSEDVSMRDWMITLFTNFMKTGNPSTFPRKYSQWRPVGEGQLNFLDIRKPQEYRMIDVDMRLVEMKQFYDNLYSRTKRLIKS